MAEYYRDLGRRKIDLRKELLKGTLMVGEPRNVPRSGRPTWNQGQARHGAKA